jgi:myo-inositol 2-dehydrogenase/D-chiro-inositol 1-dehydrogenase
MIRFGIFGAGRIGRVHAANVARLPGARLMAVFDVDRTSAAQLAASWGGEVRSEEAIFESRDIDAVVIATPAETHAALIERAAAAGKAIFCEKPIDKDLRRVRHVLDLVTARGVSLFMAFNRRFDPSFAELRNRLVAGEAGKPEMIFLTSRDPAPPALDYVARSGGLFRDMMIHDFDVARWLVGEEPERVFAVGGCFANPAIAQYGFVDTAVVMLWTPSGTIININCAMRATYGYDQRLEVHGSAGKLALDNRYATSVSMTGSAGSQRELPLAFFAERYADAYIRELTYFVECLENGIRPSPSGEDGFRALLLAEAAHRSRDQGTPVSIDGVLGTL